MSLEDFTVRAGKLKKKNKKSRIEHISFQFNPPRSGLNNWDSMYFLTNFAAIGSRPIRLTKVEGKLAGFDTSSFELSLAVLQFNDGDTLFRTFPILLNNGNKRKQRFQLNLLDQDIILKTAPFYLGYGFRTKVVTEPFSYRLYASSGGDGMVRITKKGKTLYYNESRLPCVFPFSIEYLD